MRERVEHLLTFRQLVGPVCVSVCECVCAAPSCTLWEHCDVDICWLCCSSTWCQVLGGGGGLFCQLDAFPACSPLPRLSSAQKKTRNPLLPLPLSLSLFVSASPSITLHRGLGASFDSSSCLRFFIFPSEVRNLFRLFFFYFITYMCFVCIKKYFEPGPNSLRDAKFIGAEEPKSLRATQGVMLIH